MEKLCHIFRDKQKNQQAQIFGMTLGLRFWTALFTSCRDNNPGAMWAKPLACSTIFSHPFLPLCSPSYCTAWCEVLVLWFALCRFRSSVETGELMSNGEWDQERIKITLEWFWNISLRFCGQWNKTTRIFKTLYLSIKSYLKPHCWLTFSIYGQKVSLLLPLLHFLSSFILLT